MHNIIHGNNDDGSTTLTKMKNTSSVNSRKVQSVNIIEKNKNDKTLATHRNTNIVWMKQRT